MSEYRYDEDGTPGWLPRSDAPVVSDYALEPHDRLAKRRAVLDRNGCPVAWIDYDDVSREEADEIAARVLRGMNSPPDVDALLTQLHERHRNFGRYVGVNSYFGVPRPRVEVWVNGEKAAEAPSLREALQAALEDTP